VPSPQHDRLGPPKHLSAENLTRLLRSLIVEARWFAFPLLQGLLTLRTARSDLSCRLESATGRSDAYPDRTSTCQNNASFRTHHVILSASSGRARCQCGAYRAFAIWTRPYTSSSADDPFVPCFLEAEWTYTAHANPENPSGTSIKCSQTSSITWEPHPRSQLPQRADLQDYGAQLGRSFEREKKFQKPLLRQ